jgi:DNA-binding transcriptional ArsR family regulator
MATTDAAKGSTLDRNEFFFALDDPLRRQILALLAQGRPLSVSEMAASTKRDPDLVSKHLRVLRDAGVVARERDTGRDGRRQVYEVPDQFLETPGVLDFGFCMLRFG